jgi:hypothetical protein
LAGIVEFMSNEKIYADALNNATRNPQDKKNPFSTKEQNGDSFKKRKVNGKHRNGNPKRAK